MAKRTVKTILDQYRAHTLTRLDALWDVRVTTWDDVELLLAAFREGDAGDDAHLRHFSLEPLEKAKVDKSRLVRALVGMVFESEGRDTRDKLLERVTDLLEGARGGTAAIEASIDDLIEPLVANARGCLERGGARAVWDDRWSFEVLWRLRGRDDGARVVAFACELLLELYACKALEGDGSIFSCAVDALEYLGGRAAHAATSLPVIEAGLETTCSDVVRAAAAALCAVVGPAQMVERLPPILERVLARGLLAYPDAFIDPLAAAKVDWFPVLLKLVDSDGGELVYATDPGRLLRSKHATPARVEQLRALTRSRRKLTAETAAALLTLVKPASTKSSGGDLASRIVRFEKLPALCSRNPYDHEPVAAVHAGSLWVPQQHIARAAPSDEWMNDEETFGVRRVDPVKSADETFLLPMLLPMSPNGASGDKRLLKLVAVDDNALIAIVREPFADDSGWGSRNFLLRLDIAQERWSLLSRTAKPRPLTAKSKLAPKDAWSHAELVAWVDEDGAVHTHVDDTPYFLDDWEQSANTASTRKKARRAKKTTHLGVDHPILNKPWLRGLELMLRVEAARVGLEEPALEVIGAGVVDKVAVLLVSAADPDTQEPTADLVVTLSV